MARSNKKITTRHIAAFLASIVITVLIISYRDYFTRVAGLSYFGAFLITLIGNATLILPAPAIVYTFVLGGELNPIVVGLLAGLGGTLGEITGYLAGYSGSGIAKHTNLYKKVRKYTESYGLLAIGLFAFVPNPTFDLVGIAAGALKIKLCKFLVAAVIGITAKMLIIAFAGAQ